MKQKLACAFLVGGIGLGVVLLLGVVLTFQVLPMGSPSMEPMIHGESSPEAGDGDWLVILRRVEAGDLHVGELVLVPVEPGVATVREIISVGTSPDSDEHKITVASPNPNTLVNGEMLSSEVLGKVVYVHHRRKNE